MAFLIRSWKKCVLEVFIILTVVLLWNITMEKHHSLSQQICSPSHICWQYWQNKSVFFLFLLSLNSQHGWESHLDSVPLCPSKIELFIKFQSVSTVQVHRRQWASTGVTKGSKCDTVCWYKRSKGPSLVLSSKSEFVGPAFKNPHIWSGNHEVTINLKSHKDILTTFRTATEKNRFPPLLTLY